VAVGKASLPLPPASAPARPLGGAKVQGKRVFSRESLEDF